MKTRKSRVALLLSLCLLLASLVTVLIVSAEGEEASVVTVVYANGVTETYAEGETIVPIAVPTDFVKCDDQGDAYVYTVSEGAEWRFLLNGEVLTEMTVTSSMLGKTVTVDVDGTLGTEKVWYTIREVIQDETVPVDKRGEFFIYGYDEASLITYLSRENKGEDADNPRYRYLRQEFNEFYITLYQDIYPTKFDPRWGASSKDWALPNKDGSEIVMCQDRTFRGTYNSDGSPKCSGTSAQVFFNLNGHTLEVGSSEAFHFGSMACTPYSMRLYFYSTVPGAVFSGAKSEAVFYSDDDSSVYVGELAAGDTQYGQNLSVYGKMVAHVNYGGGVYLWGGRYYQVGVNHAFLNISHRLFDAQNCEFYLADQSEAILFFNDGQKSHWKTTSSPLQFENCTFYVNQYGTKLLREVSSRTNAGVEKEAVPIDQKYNLSFVNCSFYGVPVVRRSAYLNLKYEGESAYSVSSDANFGTSSNPAYISYLTTPTKTATLYDMDGNEIKVEASCGILPASEVACITYQGLKTYWQPGVAPFAYDRAVMTSTERYVESQGEYQGLPETLEAGRTYAAEGVVYHKKTFVAFVYVMSNGVEGYGLMGETAVETGVNFANKVNNLSDATITLLSDMVLTKNVDFGTKGKIALDMNGYKITVAANATPVGTMHRIGDAMEFSLYSSRSGAVYENLSDYPIFSIAYGGKGGSISLGNYTYKLGESYSGENVTYISRGSIFMGYPKNESISAAASFTASNCNFVYTGSGAAFVCANEVNLENSRITLMPEDANATPVAIATRSDATASVGVGGCAIYTPDGVNATSYVCLDVATGATVTAATKEQRVGFGNTSFYNVDALLTFSVENVDLSYTGHVAFSTMNALYGFYDGQFPAGKNPAFSSAEFYIDGARKRIPLLLLAADKDIASVTFDTGKANLGSVTEDWLIGSVACKENFVFADIFVYTYGTRAVGENSNVLIAGCKNLAAGTMRINLSWTSGLKLNLWVPKTSVITAVTVNGVKTNIQATLDYKGDYYLVQTPITPDMLAKTVTLVVETAENSETLQLQLSSYVAKLLASENVSREEKLALYALVEVAEEMLGRSMGLQVPAGYVRGEVFAEAAPSVSGAITSIGFDVKTDGAVLSVKGTSGTQITLVSAGGERFTGVIENGVCRFENVPVHCLIDEFRLECGENTFVYSVAAYKMGLAEIYQVRADVLYTYINYVNELYIAAHGA